MTENLLILGGTTEAAELGKALADTGRRAMISLAGRVESPRAQPLPHRVGGFGGVDGLAAFLRDHRITRVVDATHPFAAQMSRNAVAACDRAGVPLAGFTRAPWAMQAGDKWLRVPDMAGAVRALEQPAARVFLAVGRMHLDAFAVHPQHFYLLRLVDPPNSGLPFPNHHAEISRGPFTVKRDMALLQDHRIGLIVSKNSGGSGAYAKIEAARTLGLPVIMIDRPVGPTRTELSSVAAVIDWLDHPVTDLGV